MGFVLWRLRKKRSYLARWRTKPPEIVISSVRTHTCKCIHVLCVCEIKHAKCILQL